MAVIPTFQRQQGLPRSTGMTGLPAVKIDDHIGNALGNHSQTATAIGGKLVEAQAVSEVSTATVSAQLKLAELETKLSKQDGILAGQTFCGVKLKLFMTMPRRLLLRLKAARCLIVSWATLFRPSLKLTLKRQEPKEKLKA